MSVRNADWSALPLLCEPKDLYPIYPGGKNAVYALFHRADFPAVRHGRRFFVSRDALRRWFETGK